MSDWNDREGWTAQTREGEVFHQKSRLSLANLAESLAQGISGMLHLFGGNSEDNHGETDSEHQVISR
ncbi:hypothetical protein A2209_01595 [Candidatus Roizmanbacteria bacterium RIFOXYA1_FULL_41_12]|uniref:Uncharacterized protein n=1 Tax=Candidatus Roizmanbacteria bacterium RIFOXYA1_FULL_41_12 TaxID=1802082 RepID=A0A1F7KF00_9BACT|nr:MAG: hypothetical protein A2209_01595 [Candidatus Roizmanbacteria bacterium RIFOXYA1_FULL_41_12]OGK68144.1 MAG: hypothetical protein A2377_04255 [Candidatus Roizmanbacteria bacterium RIFOXYB1_FULL_41_27]OGK68572.1 MAG: hypothetical protein A2262_02140 [Candidatus Roizmanbacteria bacterium RIFOXYA2_FULL_41_8]OGK71930.1 MAG: hypothetical protein A2403_03175 [Candidatus Roizmanbacteria bacterium RIFOXYC1_FULL_41_16]OGK75337.1 MAG: hypothetical protein A2575_01870 [Candidatus Roizmanbacteria bac